eukprot:1484991-Heterocapsa_arctica.AAC.1
MHVELLDVLAHCLRECAQVVSALGLRWAEHVASMGGMTMTGAAWRNRRRRVRRLSVTPLSHIRRVGGLRLLEEGVDLHGSVVTDLLLDAVEHSLVQGVRPRGGLLRARAVADAATARASRSRGT